MAIVGLGTSKLAAGKSKSTGQFLISRGVQLFYAFGWLFAFTVPFRWELLALAVASYYLRMFFVTAGYHRYFSHMTFQTSRAFQFFLAFMAETSVQQGVCWWAAHHRQHHRQCDTEKDPHSPSRLGFWKSHMLWVEDADNYETHWELVPDLVKFPEIVAVSESFLIPPTLYGAAIYLLGGYDVFIWAFVVSTWAVSHGTFLVNSANHIWGRERFICQYQPGCTAKNNWWVTVFTLGEGWHNNHHANMKVCRQGIYWYEIDITYYVLRVLQALGIVWNIREPNYEGVDRRKAEFLEYKAKLAGANVAHAAGLDSTLLSKHSHDNEDIDAPVVADGPASAAAAAAAAAAVDEDTTTERRYPQRSRTPSRSTR
ncbi:fatty-acid desaturase [Capsaspora owczarzaki ATCC 30864]|uniref:Fatty-acid desaturase n=1 Tax=Capsaspora owczarzaki (strain ATCC 30864) TaxID=595528 RepID=A0A0D2UFH7_CAPO3|nr:fatty-acid desaturase [Capsaspora owczarzaki ATCC 30864]KJE93881.1 fatty-acid desaturase [Capsaspora owczarzaki ATCC 30864]|eukprot:XP_004347347.2 fatty-acid desaturase [Capsaspora owczarzaki ATCC 30864]